MGVEAYYHYTSEAGKNGILKDGAISPSNVKDGDACFGNGVYLTKIPPGSGAEHSGLRAQGYKYAVKVMLPDHKVKQCRKDVYMFPEPVKLDMTN